MEGGSDTSGIHFEPPLEETISKMARRRTMTFLFLRILALLGLVFCSFQVLGGGLVIPIAPTVDEIWTTDLVDGSGKVLGLSEVRELFRAGVDLSQLNPKSASGLWEERRPGRISPISNKDDFYKGPTKACGSAVHIPSGWGTVSFICRNQGKSYSFVATRTYRNYLLRSQLLRRLGYQISRYHFVNRLEILFDNLKAMQDFKRNLNSKLLIDPEKENPWIEHEEGLRLILRELVYEETPGEQENLAIGRFWSDMVNHKRVYNALPFVFSLLDLTESLSYLPLGITKNGSNQWEVYCEDCEVFTTNVFDARWILKEISLLDRSDFQDVVEASQFPPGVSNLVVEILIARRNELVKLLSPEVPPIKTDLRISIPPLVIDGKVNYVEFTKIFGSYPVTRFGSPGQVDFPSLSEYWKLILGLVKSNAIGGLVAKFNLDLPKTNISTKILEKKQAEFEKMIFEILETGELKSKPARFTSVPYNGMTLFFGHDLVLGGIAGVNNQVQQVDTIGLAGYLGSFSDIYLPDLVPSLTSNFRTQGQMFFTRIKPIIKPPTLEMVASARAQGKQSPGPAIENNDEPLHHLILPLWQIGLMPKDDDLKPEDRLNKFLGAFRVGESLMITFSAGTELSVNPAYRPTLNMSVGAQASTQVQALKRIHMLRVSKDQLQIYFDSGRLKPASNFGLQAFLRVILPIFGIRYQNTRPDLKTELLIIDLKKTEPKKIVEALGELLRNFDGQLVSKISKKFIVEHSRTHQEYLDANFLFFNGSTSSTQDRIKITAPNGAFSEFFYFNSLQRTGRNFAGFVADIGNALIDYYKLAPNFDLVVPSGQDSSDTPFGATDTFSATFEKEYGPEASPNDYGAVILEVDARSYLGRESLLGALAKENAKYGRELFNPDSFARTERILFFKMQTQLVVHSRGLDRLFASDQSELFQSVMKFGKLPQMVCRNIDRQVPICPSKEVRTKMFLWDHAKQAGLYQKAKSSGLWETEAKDFLVVVRALYKILPFSEFKKLIGGDQNFFLRSSVSGYRKGDDLALENPVIYSNSYGTPAYYENGIVRQHSELLYMVSEGYRLLPSEILGHWFIKR